jgi:hypothetical protein
MRMSIQISWGRHCCQISSASAPLLASRTSKPDAGEHLDQELATLPAVLGDQDPVGGLAGGEADDRSVAGDGGLLAGGDDADGEVDAQLAVADLDVTAESAGELLRERGSGARFTRAAGAADEGLEVGAGEAGEGEAAAQEGALGVVGVVFEGEVEAELAGSGELDGVAEEEEKQLAQLGAVGAAVAGELGIAGDAETQAAAFGAEVEHVLEVVDQLQEIEVGAGARLVGVLAGELEDVVDEGEQLLAAALDDLDVGELFGGELAVLAEQLGEAEDGVERGAQLVAHVGEEGDAGALGPLGGEAGLLQSGLDAGHGFAQGGVVGGGAMERGEVIVERVHGRGA